MLLRRHDITPLEAISRLGGIQAQAPLSPYVGLWTRLNAFEPTSLASLLVDRQVVRGLLMRSTVHLVPVADYVSWRPLTAPVIARQFTNGPFGKQVADPAAVVAAGLELLASGPLSLTELSAGLAPLFPSDDPKALGYAIAFLVPLIQVPPRGLWPTSGPAKLSLAQDWLGRELGPSSVDDLVLRYFGAFGPATVKDAQQWSGLTRLREVVERLPLMSLGDGYFDLPDAPRPPEDMPAPVRFLPQYDNLLLSHAVRTRFITDGRRVPLPPGHGAGFGSVLVDGFYRADWRVTDGNLYIEPFSPLSKAEQAVVDEEGDRLLTFVNS